MPHGAVPFPFGDCRICNDKATGVHYGVATCEGCKGFFKRSIPKGDKYKCFYGGHCVLTPQNRNRCKACRFHRCVTAGMSIEAVKMGRIPKIDKERALEAARRKEYDRMHRHHHHPMDTKMHSVTPYALPGIDSLGNTHNAHLSSGQMPGALPSVDYAPMPSGISPLQGSQFPFNYDMSYPKTAAHCTSSTRSPLAMNNNAQNMMMHQGIMEAMSSCESPEIGAPCGAQTNRQGPYSPEVMKDILMDTASLSDPVDQGGIQQYMHHLNFKHEMSDTPGLSHHQTSCSPASMHCYSNMSPSIVSTAMSSVDAHHGFSSSFTGYDHQCKENKQPGNQTDVNAITSSVQTGDCQTETPCLMSFAGTATGMPGKNSLTGATSTSTALQQNPVSIAAGDVNKSSISQLVAMTSSTSSSMVSTTCQYNSPSGFSDSIISGQSPSQLSTSTDDPDVVSIKQELDLYLQEVENEPSLYPIELPSITDAVSLPQSTYSGVNGLANLGSIDAMAGNMKVATIDTSSTCTSLVPALNAELLSCNDPFSLMTGSRTLEEIEMFEETLKRLSEAVEHYNAIYDENFTTFEKEMKGEVKPHPMNCVKKATRPQIEEVWRCLIDAVPAVNDAVFGLCTKVPGFVKLDASDQSVLMEYAYFDLWLIMSSPFFHLGDLYLKLPNGANYSRFWMKHYFPDSLVDGLCKSGQQIKDCQLTPTELGVVAAVQLTCPNRGNMKNEAQIKLLNNYFLDVLAYVIPRNHGDRSSRVLIEIFRILPALETLAIQQNEIWMNCSLDHPPAGCYASRLDEMTDTESPAISSAGQLSDSHDQITLSA